MKHFLLILIIYLCLLSQVFAQEDGFVYPVSIGDAALNQACDALTIDGTVVGDIPYVRVQLALASNPMVLLLDEIVRVENGTFSGEELELYSTFKGTSTSALIMVTGWDGSNYITALQSDGIRSVWCSDNEGAVWRNSLPGLRYMRSSRQNWINYASFNAESSFLEGEDCQNFLASHPVPFADTLMEGQSDESSFPVTLMIAENGYLLRLDWERHLFYSFDDGGFSYGWYVVDANDDGIEDEDNDIVYEFYLWFTSLNSFTGQLSIQHPGGCQWYFDWRGERSPE